MQHQAWAAGFLVLVLATTAAGPVAAAPDMTERNVQYLLSALRAEAERHGQTLPDLDGFTAEGVAWDAQGERAVQVPAMDALRLVARTAGSVDLAALPQSDVVPGPATGVGDNLHGYASLRFFDCSAKSYYKVELQTPVPVKVPGPSSTPDPLFPLVPVAQVTVWGGPVMRVTGSGWLLGAHAFVGTPLDVNLHTDGHGGVGAGLVVGLDGSVDAIGAMQMATFTIPIRFWGFCLFSIDLGYILENGALRVDGRILP